MFMLLAAVVAAMSPLSANSQIAPEKPHVRQTGPTYNYTVFAGWGYTSINQINQSRSGLQGFTGSLTRDWGKYFGLTVDAGHYAWQTMASNAAVGKPSVDYYLAGPEFHSYLYGPTSLFAHALIGVAHVGGVNISPAASPAGGVGIGMDYHLKPRVSLRLYGDDIFSDFTVVPYQQGFSPHIRWNARAGLGVAYRF
jgi:hypothetical protein